ncbi:MAG: hypothetical protein ACTHJM_06180 [Marmoricola sp.]
MIIAWVGLFVVIVVVLMALPASTTISSIAWPEDAPLHLHDDRARDPHLRHLARILSSDSSREAQAVIADLAEGIVSSSAIALFEGAESARARLGPVDAFVTGMPPKDHDQFLRRLGDALDRIERL